MVPVGAVVCLEPSSQPAARAVCYRCHKPRLTCICAQLPLVANRTAVWVTQHPRERFHPLGTARIARLGLDNVHVEVVHRPSAQAPASLPQRAALLFPGPRARELGALEPHELPEALVVLDGTWAHAHTLYRDNSWLQRLPHVRLTPPSESRYRVRKEPAAWCLSTIEAIVAALRILEPTTAGLDELLATFDAMIDRQIELIEQHRSGPRQRREPRSTGGVPRWCLDEPERLVAVGIEAAPRRAAADGSLALVQCVALRVATAEAFQQFVRPPAGRFPSARHLHHMGLSAALLDGGGSLEDLRDAWSRFVTPDDIVVAWNKRVLDALGAAVGLPARRVHLKSAYRSHAKQARGPLSELARELGLGRSAPAGLLGRSARHVAEVGALLAHLQSRARHE